jgi:hypothetical protein
MAYSFGGAGRVLATNPLAVVRFNAATPAGGMVDGSRQ